LLSSKKCVASFAAALGGLETLVFSAGIGENAPAVRARICDGLGFLGIKLDVTRNEQLVGVISTDSSHLVMDSIDRLPQTGDKGIYLKQLLRDKLIEHKQYIAKYGQDLPEIRNWKWSNPK
jgi:hypothetical protein